MTVTRILAFDTSLTRPGVAVVEFKEGKAKVIDVSHVSTSSTDSIPLRSQIVEAWATTFIEKHRKKGFDYVYKEDFHGQSSQQNYPVFAAWLSIDRALSKFGLTFDKYTYKTSAGKQRTAHGISQSRAKMLVVGRGVRVSKEEVAEAVTRLTKFKGEFAKDDESDAVCIALACAIQLGLYPDVNKKL